MREENKNANSLTTTSKYQYKSRQPVKTVESISRDGVGMFDSMVLIDADQDSLLKGSTLLEGTTRRVPLQ